jgi:hypothetical protein
MSQKFVLFKSGRGMSSAIEDFVITVLGEARDVALLDRERVRLGEAHIGARRDLVREAVERVTRVTQLEGEAHAINRHEIIAEAIARSVEQGAPPLDGTPRTIQVATATSVWVARDGEIVVVWGLDEPRPRVSDSDRASNQAMLVYGAARHIGREKRETIAFADWRDGEIAEATIDGIEVSVRRAAMRLQVWGRNDRPLPYARRNIPVEMPQSPSECEVVADGAALHIGRIDRRVITRDAATHEVERAELMKEFFATIKADRQLDGWRERRLIDGVDCMMRRDGWRIVVWGAGESEPPIDPLPMPPGGDEPGMEVPTARIAVANFGLDGKPFRKPNVETTPELQAKREELLRQISEVERSGDTEGVLALQAQFVETFHQPTT